MAYSTALEARIDKLTLDWSPALTKKKMFGGLAYFSEGQMCFAIRGDELLLHLNDAQAAVLITKPGIHEAHMGQRVMKNWQQGGNEAIDTDADLLSLLEVGLESLKQR